MPVTQRLKLAPAAVGLAFLDAVFTVNLKKPN